MDLVCELCQKPEKEVRFRLLVEVTEQEISTWTNNILSLDRCGKLCTKCCQSVSFVGEMLFRWRTKIHVSLHTAKEGPEPETTIFRNPIPELLTKELLGKKIPMEIAEEEAAEVSPDDDFASFTNCKNREMPTKCADSNFRNPQESELCIECGELLPDDCKCACEAETTRRKKFSCKLCAKEFRSKQTRKAHELRTHQMNGEGSFDCKTCSRQFSTFKHCLKHEKAHHPKPEQTHDPKPEKKLVLKDTIVCSALGCGKTVLKESYDRHLHAVHGVPIEKTFLCRFCSETFARIDGLLSHERKHSDEKPYRCKLCQKSFRARQYLQAHVSVHTGVKGFKCAFCDRHFRTANNRETHQRHVHKSKQFPCPNQCGKTFIRKKYATSHGEQCVKSNDSQPTLL